MTTIIHHKIEKIKKKVNPKIAQDILNLMKPYLDRINHSSDYYKLKSLAIDMNKVNIKVKKDVERLLEMFKIAAQNKIEKKIKQIHGLDNVKNYEAKDIGVFTHKHRIKQDCLATIRDSIYGRYVVNLSIEDFKLITKNAKKAKDPVDSKTAELVEEINDFLRANTERIEARENAERVSAFAKSQNFGDDLRWK